MLIMGYGISMDVENLCFVVFDCDQIVSSQVWIFNFFGFCYFIEQLLFISYDEFDCWMCVGDIMVVIEILFNFGCDIVCGMFVEFGVWIDGVMLSCVEMVKGYVQVMYQSWLQDVVS